MNEKEKMITKRYIEKRREILKNYLKKRGKVEKKKINGKEKQKQTFQKDQKLLRFTDRRKNEKYCRIIEKIEK